MPVAVEVFPLTAEQMPVEVIPATPAAAPLQVLTDIIANTATTVTVHDNSSTATSTTVQTSSECDQLEPESKRMPVALKRKSFFKSPATHKQPKASNTHKEFSAMAQSKCVQLDEQLGLMKAREEREKELHQLQVEKIQLEMAVIKDNAARAKEAHEVEMRVKDAKLKLIIKQLQEE